MICLKIPVFDLVVHHCHQVVRNIDMNGLVPVFLPLSKQSYYQRKRQWLSYENPFLGSQEFGRNNRSIPLIQTPTRQVSLNFPGRHFQLLQTLCFR